MKINGMEVDLDKIGNPKLRRVIRDRERDFLFSYGDAYSVRSRGHKHTEETRANYFDYKERATHEDCTSTGSGGPWNDHEDHTEHSEEHSDNRPYGDHYGDTGGAA